MQKIFGVLFILVAVWIAIEVYTKGTDAAFGGLFAGHSPAHASVQSDGTLPDQVRESVQSDGNPDYVRQSTLPDQVRDRVNEAFRAHEERTRQQTNPQ
jgi:hypothetical protein